MALVSMNKKQFEKEIGKLDEKMQEKISLFGTNVENLDNEKIDIEVLPNRPDMLSYQGFKRSFLSFLGKAPGIKKYSISSPEKDFKVILDPSIKDIRPYTACAIIKGLDLNDEKIKEIIDIQEKLHITLGRKRKKIAIGIYPLEKIKLPITFKALEPDKIKFIPLESVKEMSGLEILQRHPTGKDYAHLLAGKMKFPIFVDAEGKILSMPPIINSQLTGKVSEATRDVFVECSGFDFKILSKCLNTLVTTLADMGGKIYQMEIQGKKFRETTPNLNSEKMKISIENANKLLGLELKEKDIKSCLEKMGYNYNKGFAEIPSWRADVLHEVDLIEDIAIAYGYENFIPEIPNISTIGQENKKEVIKKKIAEILSGLGMLEVMNYHLTSKKEQIENMLLKMQKQEKEFIEVEDSKTDYNLLRKSLAFSLLKTLSENIDSEYPQKIFEIGRVFSFENNQVIEKENLAAAISPANFTEIKQVLECLSRSADFEIKFKEAEHFPEWFIEGRVAEVLANNKKIGFIGEIHPKILSNWKIKMPVSIFEINLDEIFKNTL